MSHISNIDVRDCDRVEGCSDAVDKFMAAIKLLAQQHRPSRMPFFHNLATLDRATAGDPSLLARYT
jgi:hypothetical protein